jgi:hypothetical protein
MRRLFILLLLVVDCTPKDATPVGTTVLDWDTSKASRATVTTAKVGARTKKDVTVKWTPIMGHPVTATLHVESAPIDFVETGKPVSQTSVVAVSMKLTTNDYWKATGKCSGPDYQMPSIVDGGFVTANGMVVQCSVNIEQSGSNEILDLVWTGDGPVNATTSGKVEVQ